MHWRRLQEKISCDTKSEVSVRGVHSRRMKHSPAVNRRVRRYLSTKLVKYTSNINYLTDIQGQC